MRREGEIMMAEKEEKGRKAEGGIDSVCFVSLSIT